MCVKDGQIRKASDTGQGLTLLCLILFAFTSQFIWLGAAMAVLVINMLCPVVFVPASYVWFGVAECMGFVVSRILLTSLFVLVVLPVGLVRSCAGSDPMRFRDWKHGSHNSTRVNINKQGVADHSTQMQNGDSVFVERNHTYSGQDILHPY